MGCYNEVLYTVKQVSKQLRELIKREDAAIYPDSVPGLKRKLSLSHLREIPCEYKRKERKKCTKCSQEKISENMITMTFAKVHKEGKYRHKSKIKE